jgi:hypothetical protein
MKMEIGSELAKAWEEAIQARQEYRAQKKRAEDLYEKLKNLIYCDLIGLTEIIVPIKWECKSRHHKHYLALNGLYICYEGESGIGYCWGVDPITSLKLILNYAKDLVEAARRFRENEKAKTKEISDFLDFVEETFKPVLIAASLKK